MGNFLLSSPHIQTHLSEARPKKTPDRVRTAPPTPTPKDKSETAGKLAEMLAELAESVTSTDALMAEIESLRDRVEAVELANKTPKLVQFQVGNNQPGPALSGVRPEVAPIIRKIGAGIRNIYLCGPAGTGKSTIPKTIAEALGKRFGGQSFSPDMNSAALIGGPTVSGGWNEPAFIDFFENGGVYLFDELDAADPSIVLVLNEALANGYLYIPRHPDHSRRIIRRHEDCVIFAAANTWGNGPTAEYVGRSQLDAAFVNRFALAKHFIGYDQNIERRIMGLPEVNIDPPVSFDPPADSETVLKRLWRIRDDIATYKIRRVCGTREVAAAAKLSAAGFSEREIIEALSIDWTEAEKRKVDIL